jgi:DnaJ-class molecular chaperone
MEIENKIENKKICKKCNGEGMSRSYGGRFDDFFEDCEECGGSGESD